MRQTLIALALAAAGLTAATAAQRTAAVPPVSAADRSAIAAAVADPARSAADRARDRYRHPAETLAFFGVRPGQTLVEYSPGGGWYSEILAPLTNGRGSYVALVPTLDPKPLDAARARFEAKRARYGAVTLATLDPATGATTVPDGSADVVLTFRNVHNLLMGGDGRPERAFAAFFRMLKPGGTLGVVDHRLPENRPAAQEEKSGYVKRSTILRLATAAGFRLAGESEVNRNPKDTADWPDGVWTLPPTLTLKEKDREKYLAIGESDRLTMRFVKPKG